MGLFRKARAVFHDDWCSRCQTVMDVTFKRLYALPMTVGHYVSHKEPEYYKTHLSPVERKADIHTGGYACGIHAYRCPECGHRAVRLSIFLPVRGVEKPEEALYFEDGEMDDFIHSSGGSI